MRKNILICSVCFVLIALIVVCVTLTEAHFKTQTTNNNSEQLTPDEPAEPDIPDEPDEPVEPDIPDEPDEPVEPDIPDIPDEPDEPVEPERTVTYVGFEENFMFNSNTYVRIPIYVHYDNGDVERYSGSYDVNYIRLENTAQIYKYKTMDLLYSEAPILEDYGLYWFNYYKSTQGYIEVGLVVSNLAYHNDENLYVLNGDIANFVVNVTTKYGTFDLRFKAFVTKEEFVPYEPEEN